MGTSNPPISPMPVRNLSSAELGLDTADAQIFFPLEESGLDMQTSTELEEAEHLATSPPPISFPAEISESDPILATVKFLLSDGFAGVILFGPPGTSKSWYARQIAAHLAGQNADRIRLIQFHPAYQYEDFIEAYSPTEDGKFQLTDKVFLELCRVATEDFPGETCVLVIDEFSRCDVARVFGEALTYLETGKRGMRFRLPSGRQVSIPENIAIIATMNPWDRGVDDLDAALERRFAKIALQPDAKLLQDILISNNVNEELRSRILRFFETVKNHQNPLARIGHAYFRGVTDETALARLWDHQLSFHFDRAFRLDTPSLEKVKQNWQQTLVAKVLAAPAPEPSANPPALAS